MRPPQFPTRRLPAVRSCAGRNRRRAAAALLVALVLAATPVNAEIAGDIVRVGYLATAGSVVRVGQWVPVVVDLRLQGQSAFDGLLRLRQFDGDGDVYVDSVPVHLLGEAGQQTYMLYTVANPAPAHGSSIVVELLETPDGAETNARVVNVVSGAVPVPYLTPPVEAIVTPDSAYMILSVSDRPMGQIRVLANSAQAGKFDRPITLVHGAPEVIPNLWIGLEMVDCIVWDEADPTRLTDEQERALVEWVRQGGKLVLAAARTAPALAQAKHLGPLLPVEMGRVRSTTVLPTMRQRMVGIVRTADVSDAGYPRAIAVTTCRLRKAADTKTVLYERELQSPLVATRRVGCGHIVFVAATLRDLLSDPHAAADLFFKRLLELRRNPFPDAVYSADVPIHRYLDWEVGFFNVGSYRMALAVLFAIAYVLVATLGAWKFLAGRNLLRHSWTGLAVLAVVASLVSIVGVQAVHGVGRTVHQLSVVDGVGGSAEARATVYFGLTAATHTRLDVWMPEDSLLDRAPKQTSCTLRPLLDYRDLLGAPTSFTDPGRYELEPATAELRDVPVRATLKQFEGRWSGILRGTVASGLTAGNTRVRRSPGDDMLVEEYMLTRDSWIRNDLDVDLNACYLLLAERDAFTITKSSYAEQAQRASAAFVRVLPLGTIARGAQIDIFATCYADADGQCAPLATREGWTLERMQTVWGKPFADAAERNPFAAGEDREDYNLGYYQNAALLATILSEIDPNKFRQSITGWFPVFSRNRLRALDISDLLTRRTALFVGFADEPGPARLFVRKSGAEQYERIDPSRARTTYRFILPVEVRDDLEGPQDAS